jgi:hypothetical protein
MQVTQITGNTDNPNIWQFFVTVAGLSLGLFVLLTISDYWTRIQYEREGPRMMERLHIVKRLRLERGSPGEKRLDI